MNFWRSPLLLGIILFFAPLLAAETESGFPVDQKFYGKKLSFVPVEDANNPADVETGFGAVAAPFQIGTYKVTAAQYALFLNAAAVDGDPYQLYDERMASDPDVACITYDATRVPHYKTISGREDLPVTYVDLFCAVRFCNWLSHGCGRETETGAYEIHHECDALGVAREWIEETPEAPFFLAHEDQWYKAAYYHHDTGKIITYDPDTPIPSVQDQGSFHYWNYPTQSMNPPCNSIAMATSWGWVHNAIANYYYPNLSSWWGPEYTTDTWFYWDRKYHHQGIYLTPVGNFDNAPGPYGTFDMGGDVDEWIFSSEAGATPDQVPCVIRGGCWQSKVINLEKHTRQFLTATIKNNTTGFRVSCSLHPAAFRRDEVVPGRDDVTRAVIANATAATTAYLDVAEMVFFFVAQEAFEMAVIYDAVEGSLLKEYFLKMLPVGALTTVLDWSLFGVKNATDWALQWALHMAGDSIGLGVIDLLGTAEAKVFAKKWGLQPIVDFYEGLHEGCHTVLDPIKKGLNDIAEPVIGRRLFSEQCGHAPQSDHSVQRCQKGSACKHGIAPPPTDPVFCELITPPKRTRRRTRATSSQTSTSRQSEHLGNDRESLPKKNSQEPLDTNE